MTSVALAVSRAFGDARSTTSRSAAVTPALIGLMKRDNDCVGARRRKPRSAETASLACRIFPSRSKRTPGRARS